MERSSNALLLWKKPSLSPSPSHPPTCKGVTNVWDLSLVVVVVVNLILPKLVGGDFFIEPSDNSSYKIERADVGSMYIQ